MRPIAHARRQSSRAASSRHAVDALVVGNPVPLGIPALFLADQRHLSHCSSQPRPIAPTSVSSHDEWAPDGRRPTVQRRATA
jgi:hypothetical protein